MAANAFWRSVQKNNFDYVIDAISDRDFQKVWNIDDLIYYAILINMDITDFDVMEFALALLYKTVNEHMYSLTNNKKNINGSYHLEDFKYCRTGDFNEFNILENLKSDTETADKEAVIKINKKIRKIGDLLIRSPLPASVPIKEREFSNIIEVDNTIKALGFQKKLILGINSISELIENEYGYRFIVSGIFQIPATRKSDNLWKKIIPNAIYIFGSIQITI